MQRGPARSSALLVALLPGGLLTYLLISNKGAVIVQVILAIIFGLLLLRGVGLRRARGEASPDGHIGFATEFEGPEEPDDD
jgi:hypothetical protein